MRHRSSLRRRALARFHRILRTSPLAHLPPGLPDWLDAVAWVSWRATRRSPAAQGKGP